MSLEKMVISKLFKQQDQTPFKIIFQDGEVLNIGEGEARFIVKVNGNLSKSLLLTSTSLALGEAYMDKTIDIEGDLYEALDIVLGKLDHFNIDEKALNKLMFSSTSKRNQKKKLLLITI